MSKTPEGLVKDQIKKELDARGICYFMPVQFGYGKRGVDFYCTLPPSGRALLIEAKRPDGGKLKKSQAKILVKNMESGGISVIAVCWKDVVDDCYLKGIQL